MSSGPVITSGTSYVGGASSSTIVTKDDPVVLSLLVILTVVCAVIWSYYWCSPICRSLCRRWRCCCCQLEADTDSESGAFASSSLGGRSSGPGTTCRSSGMSHMGTPTLILLPHGRMLVVDGTIFAQLRAENTGLDLVELGESVMRNTPSQCSVIEMDAETPSKDSMGSLGCFPPPTYESIYGKDEGDVPPSYSDILLHRYANLLELEMQQNRRGSSKEEIELRSLDNCPHIITNPLRGTSYPYPSSRSLPRNPSLIANPLDTYYVENELASSRRSPRGQHRSNHRSHRRTRRTSFNGIEDAEIVRTRRHARSRRRSRAGSEERPALENYMDHSYTHPWDQPVRPQNEFMNSRNIARSDSIRSVDIDDLPSVNPAYPRSSRRSDESIEIEPVRVHRNSRIDSDEMNWNLNDLDVRYAPNEDRPDLLDGAAEASAEEDPNNFKALADIRESRV